MSRPSRGEKIEVALKLQDGTADQCVLLKIAREITAEAGDGDQVKTESNRIFRG